MSSHWGAAEGGASVFFVSAHVSFYIMNIHGYSLYIPYIFHIYIYICPKYFPCIFLCMVRNLFSYQLIGVAESVPSTVSAQFDTFWA